MAQVDPNIAMGFRPVQIPLEESPLNRMQKYADYENALVKSQELQQQRQERNELARIMGDPNLEFGSDAFMQQVLKRVPSQYESIATRALQRENLAAQRATREAEATKRKRELEKETFQTAVGELISYRTVEDVKTDIDSKEKAGEITPQQAAVLRAKLPTDDTQLDSWRVDTMRGLLPPKEQLADIRAEQKDIREDARLRLEDARVQETQRHQRAMEDISKSGVDRQQKQLEETQRHHEAMERLRSREINKPSAADNPNKVAHTSTDDQGNVTFYNAFGQVIRTQTNAGKRSPNLIKAEQAENNLGRDIERTTKELAEITKEGGLIDQSTGSYAGKAVDIAARTIGMATKGDIASAKLKPIADMVLKMVPRFEGPQSDKDTQSYKEAAGQLSDSTLPPKLRKEAGLTILRLMKERKNQFAGEGMDMSPEQRRAAPVAPQSDVRSRADAILGQ
jgi:hypothetical protein